MQELFKKYIHAADMEELVKQNIRQAVNDMAETLANNWDDAVAMSLYETLGDYITLATKPTEVVSAPITEDEPTTKRKKRNTPNKYRDRKVVNGRFQRLFDILIAPENIGKEIQVRPEDIDTDCSMEELHYLCSRFNSATWRMKNAPNTKLMYKKQLFNIACKFVRAEQDLRSLRWGCN